MYVVQKGTIAINSQITYHNIQPKSIFSEDNKRIKSILDISRNRSEDIEKGSSTASEQETAGLTR